MSVCLPVENRLELGVKIFTLSLISVFKILFSRSEVISNASCFWDFKNDQNIFTLLKQEAGLLEFGPISVNENILFPICFFYLLLYMCSEVMILIYTERKKKRRVNFIPKFHSSLKKFVKYFTMITKRYMYETKVPNFIGL